MLILASILNLGQSGLPTKAITNDDADRIALCLKVLSESAPNETLKSIFGTECRQALNEMIEANATENSEFAKAAGKKKGLLGLATQADSPIKVKNKLMKNKSNKKPNF